MLNDSPMVWTRLLTTLKVAAVVIVLGSVALAAHERAPAGGAPEPHAATAPATGQADAQRTVDHLPAHFSPPSGPVDASPPSF